MNLKKKKWFSQIVLIPFWSSNNFLFPLILISMNEFFINSEIMKSVTLSHAKINGLWWGPNLGDFMIDWSIVWLDYHTSCSLTCMRLFLNCALTRSLDSALIVWCQGMPRSHFDRFFIECFDSHMCMINLSIHWFSYRLPCQLHFISRDSTLGTYRDAMAFTVPSW